MKIENESIKHKTNPNKYKDKKIIKKVIEIRKKYKYGKVKIKNFCRFSNENEF